MQLRKVDLSRILFLDIETVPDVPHFADLDEKSQELFAAKVRYQIKDDQTAEDVYEKAGIWAEFGKIVCISVGFVSTVSGGQKMIKTKSFYGDDEKQLLHEFADLLNTHYLSPQSILCGHNAKEFDFPFIARRMLINGLDLPGALDIAGKKPWEINHLDTLELWKFGDYKHYTSLALLCHLFKVPTPKDDISGADVARVYYEENDVERIRVYCEKDVVALIQLFLKMRNESLVLPENIISA